MTELEVLEPREAMEYMLIFCRYLVKASEYLKEEDYKHALAMLPQGGQEIMDTLADQWMRQGRDGGLLDGKQEGLREGELKGVRATLINLAAAKFEYIPVGFTMKINAIEDIGTLNSLSLSLLKADSLEAFDALVDKATKPTIH